MIHNVDERQEDSFKASDWLALFSVPWKKMSSTLMKALNAQTRPHAQQRREMVRIIADAIRLYTPLPGIKAINCITKTVVDRYPILKDSICGETVGDGNLYLSKQIRNRLENLNRGKGTKRKSSVLQIPSDNTENKQLGLSDRYGCTNWQPSLTEEEEKIQEKEREDMLHHSQLHPVVEDDVYVIKLIEKTYPLQRKEINVAQFDIGQFKNR